MVKEKGRLRSLGVLLVITLLAGFALWGPGPAAGDAARPDQVVLSWTGDPQTTCTIAWRAGGATGGQVQYMKESEATDDFSGAAAKDAVVSDLYDGYSHFEAELDNLQPGAAYVYRVGADGSWSDPASFTTAAATDSFSFMFIGDVQDGYSAWGQLMKQARAGCPELKFAVQCGDLVDDTEDTGQWSEFFSAASGVFDHIPLMPAIGNHEDENLSLYLKSFALPQNGPEGLGERFYSFDYGNAHFAVLDSNLMGSEGAAADAGVSWLASDLQNSARAWKFIMFHHPVYSINAGNSGDTQLAGMIKEKWLPVMESNGVDMVFVGHQHMYMRTYPMYEDQIQETQTEGITYLMGNAGSKLYVNPEEHDYVAKVLTGVSTYTAISIDGNVLNMTTRDAVGNIVDEYTISKGGEMDSRVVVNSVVLLDDTYQAITSVPAQGYCRLQARLKNNTSKSQTTLAVIQLRSGDGATAGGGGESLGIASLQADVPAAGADVYADFTLPALAAGSKVYVDVFLLDKASVPIDWPYQKFSFTVAS